MEAGKDLNLKPELKPSETKPAALPTKQEQQKQTLLAKSEVSLWIDTYDDIFSDFDPRPYQERALSDDFLFEAKKVSKETKEGNLQLRFLAPASIRKPDVEAAIKRRLREHFKKHADRLEQDTNGLVRDGVLIAILGFSLAGAAAVISFYFSATFLATLLVVLLEPAGWFTLWHGLDKAIYEPRDKSPDLKFYQKMAKGDIVFDSY